VDIAERKEEALKESERRFAAVLANARAYVYRCRNEEGYPNEFASDYALELTGYPPEDLLLLGGPVTFGELILEENRQRVWEEVQGALGSRERYELRYSIRRRDGEVRNVEESGQGIYDEEGEVVALEGIVYDVTQRERTEKRLWEAEERYRTLVEQVPAVTYIQEATGSNAVTYVSPQIELMLGYKPEECTSDPEHWIKILHPADRRRVLAEDERTGETGEPFSMEYRQFAKDGRVVWVRDEAVLVRDEEGNPSYWLGVQHDFTERKRAEEEIKEVNRRLEELAVLKADFTAMVAHELNTPLAVIRGYADMLATGKLGASDRDRALAKIQAETDVMAALITDARTAAAIEREDFVVKPRRVPIGALMKAAGAFAETLRGDHPLVIENLADGQEMWADPYRIGQVLRNLLSNAAKYSPDGAPIELRAVPGETPGRVRIEVSDRGVGVHPDDVNRIFEKFGRGRDSSGRKVAGVGLGLYLSRRILQAHGSDLTLDPASGDGSVFGFELEAAR
jgi:PAS domain S-box-containing protein